MGNATQNKDSQLVYLKERLNGFLEVLDSMDPEDTELADIDRLIDMLENIEVKFEQFKKN